MFCVDIRENQFHPDPRLNIRYAWEVITVRGVQKRNSDSYQSADGCDRAGAHCWTSSLPGDRRATEPRVPGEDELGLAHIAMAAWPVWPGVRDRGHRGNRYQETATACAPGTAGQALSSSAPHQCVESGHCSWPGHHRRVPRITAACNDNIMPMLSMVDMESGLLAVDIIPPTTLIPRLT